MTAPRTVATLALVAATGLAAPAAGTQPGANGRLAFERGGDLFSVAPDGSGAVRLTKKGINTDLAFSPDGSRLAWSHAASDRGPFEIWTAKADGTQARRLTHHKRFSIAPTWSPDGRTIVYTTEVGPAPSDENDPPPPLRLHSIPAGGGHAKQLVPGRKGPFDTDPTFTPDGKTIVLGRIAFHGDQPPRYSLATIPAEGGKPRLLTGAGGPDELNPSVSPDGRTVAFEIADPFFEGPSDVAVTDVDGGAVRRLTRTNVFETNPVWSPDGTRLAFTSDRDNRKFSDERLGRGFELYTMAADGSDIARVTTNRVADAFPDWQSVAGDEGAGR